MGPGEGQKGGERGQEAFGDILKSVEQTGGSIGRIAARTHDRQTESLSVKTPILKLTGGDGAADNRNTVTTLKR